MLAIKADSFKENTALREKVVDKINNGKKVTFKLPSKEDLIAFLKQCCKLATEKQAEKIGLGVGSTIGAAVGGSFGGPVGIFIGGAIGGAIGAFIGQSRTEYRCMVSKLSLGKCC